MHMDHVHSIRIMILVVVVGPGDMWSEETAKAVKGLDAQRAGR